MLPSASPASGALVLRAVVQGRPVIDRDSVRSVNVPPLLRAGATATIYAMSKRSFIVIAAVILLVLVVLVAVLAAGFAVFRRRALTPTPLSEPVPAPASRSWRTARFRFEVPAEEPGYSRT